MNFHELLTRFTDVVPKGSDSATARCPAHEDNRNSLSISKGDSGGIVMKCHAGCDTREVVAAAGLTMKDLAPTDIITTKPTIAATYDYTDEAGNLKYQVVRMMPKDFRQRRPDGKGDWIWSLKGVKRYPYRLVELLESEASYVFIVEGEKDVERLRKHGLTATCNAGGAGKWTDAMSPYLQDRNVAVLPDNDESGRKHAAKVKDSLERAGATRVRILELPNVPDKGDVSDWFDLGHTGDDLLKLVKPTSSIVDLQQSSLDFIETIGTRDNTLISSGLKELDYALAGGIAKGEMVVVGGRPGHGKSALGMQMIYAFAKQDMPCLVISEEMPAATLGKRTVQFASPVALGEWDRRRDELRADVIAHFAERAPIQTVSNLITAEKAFSAAKFAKDEYGIEAVMIDYCQRLQGKGRGKYEQVTDVSITLSRIAHDLGLTTIVLCQLNRQIEQQGRRAADTIIPNNSDLRDSGQIEQDADVIVFGVWPIKIDPTHGSTDDYILAVTKNRNREIVKQVVTTKFDPSRMTVGQSMFNRYQDFEEYA